jgi:hypothetical protein
MKHDKGRIWKQRALGLAEMLHPFTPDSVPCANQLSDGVRRISDSIAVHETAALESVACLSFVSRPVELRSRQEALFFFFFFWRKAGEAFEKANGRSLGRLRSET